MLDIGRSLAPGKVISAGDYAKAPNCVSALSRGIGRFFEDYDVLLRPTLARPPVPISSLQMMFLQRRSSVSHRSLQCSTRPASWRCRFRSTGTKRCSPSGCSLRRASTRSRPSSALRGSSNAHSHGRQASTGTALLQRRRNRHAGGYRSRWH